MFSKAHATVSFASSSRPQLSRISCKVIPLSLRPWFQTACSSGRVHETRVRWRSSSPSSNIEKKSNQSIFNDSVSPWQQLFAGPDISSLDKSTKESNASQSTRGRRVTMTTQEQSTFTQLFDEIFRVAESVDATNVEYAPAFSKDFYDRIRKSTKKVKWDQDANEELDKKKEEMDMCQTDYELLQWSITDVFEEAKAYEEESRKATTQVKKKNVTLQPPWYPHIIALLMCTFRDKYHNPHTALAIFNYTKTLSVASYAFGCSTDAYNELITTHWSCFRDVKSVLHALNEMNVNGVAMNTKTGRLIDTIRKDVGVERLWSDEEVSNIITQLDVIRRDGGGLETTSKKFKGRQKWDQWKNQNMEDNPEDRWGFNSWDIGSGRSASLSPS